MRAEGFKGSSGSYVLTSESYWALVGFQKSWFSNDGRVDFRVNLGAVPRVAWDLARRSKPEWQLPERPSANRQTLATPSGKATPAVLTTTSVTGRALPGRGIAGAEKRAVRASPSGGAGPSRRLPVKAHLPAAVPGAVRWGLASLRLVLPCLVGPSSAGPCAAGSARGPSRPGPAMHGFPTSGGTGVECSTGCEPTGGRPPRCSSISGSALRGERTVRPPTEPRT